MVLTVGWLTVPAMAQSSATNGPPANLPATNAVAASQPSTSDLTWSSDLTSALKQAELEKKMVVVEVTPGWNISGKKLEAETFSDPEVQLQLKGAVRVKIDPESSDEARTMAGRLLVASYPSILILNYKGTVVARAAGFQEAGPLEAFLAQYADEFRHCALGPVAPELTPDDPLMVALQHKPSNYALPPRTVSYYLLDRTEVNVQKDGNSRVVSRRAVYAVNPDLAREGELGGLSTSYDASRQKVRYIYARIIDAEGKSQDLDVSQAQDKPAYSNGDVVWDEHRLTLATPKLKQGEILDYEEEKQIQPFVPGHYEMIYSTDSDRFTVVDKDLVLHFPRELGLTKAAVRCDLPVTETKAPDGTITWEVKPNPSTPSPDNLFMTGEPESWQGYLFTTPWTWDGLAAWFRDLESGRGKLTPEVATMVAQAKQQYPDAHDLVSALSRWVAENIRTYNVDFEKSSRQPHPVDETIHYRCGDGKDKALLLRSLLQEAGIPSSLVLLRRGYGNQIDGDLPMILQFDHCLVAAQVDGKEIYLDPLAEASEPGWLPVLDSKVEALKIGNKKVEKIVLPAYQPRERGTAQRIVAELHPDGSAEITSTYEFEGALATEYKSIFSRITLEQARNTFALTLKKRNEILTDFSMNDPRQAGDTFSITCVSTSPQFSTLTPDGLTFRLGEKGVGEDWSSRLIRPRTAPFRFYPSDPFMRSYEVILPPGTKLIVKPDDLHLETSFLTATQTSSLSGDKLDMTDSYATKDVVIPAAQAEKVITAFQTLENHREGIFVVSANLPPVPEAPVVSAPAPPPQLPASEPAPAPPAPVSATAPVQSTAPPVD